MSTLTGFDLITLRINWGPLIFEDSIGDDKVYIFYRCAHSLRLLSVEADVLLPLTPVLGKRVY